MAHILSKYLKLWKPQNLSIDRISSQKMFIDNIDVMENFAKVTMQKIHEPVNDLTELKAIDTSDTALFTTGMLIMVRDYGMYSFNRNSTAVESNATVVPTVGGGRWITTQITDIAMTPLQANTTDDVDILLTNIVTQMSPNSTKFVMIRVTGEIKPPFHGGTGHVTIYKSENNSYASATMILYNYNGIALYYTKSLYGDVWGKWTKLPYLDENGKIPLSLLPESVLAVNTLANAEVIEETGE